MHHIGTYSHTNSLWSLYSISVTLLSKLFFMPPLWEVAWHWSFILKFPFPGCLWLVLSTWKPYTKTQKHIKGIIYQSLFSIMPDSFSFPLVFSVLAHDERQADANERKQDSFSSFQQIFGWSCQSGNTLHRRLVSLSFSLSLSIHIHSNTQITKKKVFSLP